MRCRSSIGQISNKKPMDRFDKDVNFVARHYRRGIFSAGRDWRLLGIDSCIRRYRRVAAAVGTAVVLTASAIIYHVAGTSRPVSDAPDPATETTVATEVPVRHVVDVRDVTVRELAAEIERVYGVRIENLPAHEIRLTIRYEGTAEELVETVNGVAGTDLEIRKK